VAQRAGVVLDDRRNAALTTLAAPLMDRSTDLRQRIMRYAIDTEHSAATLAADDALLEAHLRRRVGGTWHPCCGSAMRR
jgi:hypothetical protein